MLLHAVLILTFLAFHSCTIDDIIFPRLYDGDKGHLKPFGWQRKPKSKITEYDYPLPAEKFYQDHMKHNKPLVYRQVVSKSPALTLWTDEYLREHYGDLDVLVELKKEDRDFTTGRMRFHKFLKEYKNKEIYIVSLLPEEMMSDVQAVNTVLCGTFKNFTHESNFWMSNGGTRSVIHYDADENFHCIISGRKDFILIEREYEKFLYMDDKEQTAGSNFSPIDPDKVNLKKYPDISKVDFTYATLYPGDCVYIPAKHIHQVRSYNRTIGVTTLFTGDGKLFNSFNANGCNEFDITTYHSMADIDFHWSYSKGDATIDMGYMNVEHFRMALLSPMQIIGSMNYTQFQKFFLGFAFGENPVQPKIIFETITSGKNILTKKDVFHMSRDHLKLVCRAIDPPHGPTSIEGEEVYFLPGEAPDNDEIFDDSAVIRSAILKEEFTKDVEEAIESRKDEL